MIWIEQIKYFFLEYLKSIYRNKPQNDNKQIAPAGTNKQRKRYDFTPLFNTLGME